MDCEKCEKGMSVIFPQYSHFPRPQDQDAGRSRHRRAVIQIRRWTAEARKVRKGDELCTFPQFQHSRNRIKTTMTDRSTTAVADFLQPRAGNTGPEARDSALTAAGDVKIKICFES